MASTTTKKQRIGIWIIIVLLSLGTIVGFGAMILQPQNQQDQTARINEAQKSYQEAVKKFLSEKYSKQLADYKQKEVKPFDAEEVTEVTTRDLVEGNGEEVNPQQGVALYYLGWTADGNVFDGSLDQTGNLKNPLQPLVAQKGSVIEGMTEGLKGMKQGGAREITIPAAKAYGDKEQKGIPANSPLKFIVVAISEPTEQEVPVPAALKQLQQAAGQQ